MRANIVSENAVALILCIVNKDLSRDDALRKCGVKISSSQGKSGNKSIIPEGEAEKIYKYYNKDNMTLPEIGEIYGVSATTIGNFMKNRGMKVRHRGKREEKL
ncbi:hypothetical protein [Clostridium sp. BSD9I1]|uniref:hypothetical protein n=1 Tax=Clostridium sp. BSD9I1 TaxID=2003589 RepID=UPI001644F8E4|nr:hypothetical protein [Clostridium sp. BSD9I1]